MTVGLGAYFDQDVAGVVARLVGEQLDDGGWNCWTAYGSVRSSAATTINVLEGLLAYERATGGSAESIAARRQGEEYLLERRLFRRKSTGEVIDPAWLNFSYPPRWHYDVLRPTALSLRRGSARPAPDRSGRAAPIQAAARRQVATGKHSSRAGLFHARRWRQPVQPVEHPPGVAGPRLVRAFVA